MLLVKGGLPSSPPFSLRATAIKFLRAAVALILFVTVQFASSTGLFAQEPSPLPEPMAVVVDLGHGEQLTLTSEEGSEQNIVPTVTLLPNQGVTVTLQFSTDNAGVPVLVAAYDGGQISGINQGAVVPEDGAVPFSFQPGVGPGAYRVVVQMGGEQHLLQFHVNAPEE